MKTIITSFAVTIFMCTYVSAQNTSSCCSKTSTSEFAMLGKSSSFKSSHEPPLPFTYSSAAGKVITIKCADGKDANAFEIKPAKATNNYLFVFHEWWGLNDYIKQVSEKLYNDVGDVHVIALDLYEGKTATNSDDASKLMQSTEEKRIRAIIDGAVAYAGKKAKIQTIGWCFGGGWSLQATLQMGEQAAGCVMYYGMPEKDTKKLATLSAPVLGIFADKDGWITKEVVNEFQNNLRALKKDHAIKRFEAEHAFANPSNPQYDKKNTELAYAESIAFLKKNFGF